MGVRRTQLSDADPHLPPGSTGLGSSNPHQRQTTAPPDGVRGVQAYVQIARIDHWPKNAVLLLGVCVAVFFDPSLIAAHALPRLTIALIATCLIASSNYVLNELLDAASDRAHPIKCRRPAACGRIRSDLAIAEWMTLGCAGLVLALWVHAYFALSALALWVMGIVYNAPPLRTKDVVYVDVLTESVNHALRLMLGWFAMQPDRFPPLSLLLSYWMAGAFLLSIKRIADYRILGDAHIAGAYRRAFVHYTSDRLLISAFVYAVTAALFGGVFIVRYRLELILELPLFAAFMAYCLRLGFKERSPFLEPEHLHRDLGFMLFASGSLGIFLVLLFVRIPVLYELFKVRTAGASALWQLSQPWGG